MNGDGAACADFLLMAGVLQHPALRQRPCEPVSLVRCLLFLSEDGGDTGKGNKNSFWSLMVPVFNEMTILLFQSNSLKVLVPHWKV